MCRGYCSQSVRVCVYNLYKAAWRALVNEAAGELNVQREASETRKKNERKSRMSIPNRPIIQHAKSQAVASFKGETRASLVNHSRQKHGRNVSMHFPADTVAALL